MAVVWALAVTIIGCVEAAVREASGPLTFASALIAVARLVRLLLNPVSNPAWVDKSVCWFCNAVNEMFCGLRIALTTDCTLMPFPFSRLEALKLTPIVFLLFLIPASRLWPKLKLFRSKRFGVSSSWVWCMLLSTSALGTCRTKAPDWLSNTGEIRVRPAAIREKIERRRDRTAPFEYELTEAA